MLLNYDFCPLDTFSKHLSLNFILSVSLKYWAEQIFGKFYGDVFRLLRIAEITKIGPRLQKLLNGLHFRWNSIWSNLFENLKPFRPDLVELNGQDDSKSTENSTKFLKGAFWRSPLASKKFLIVNWIYICKYVNIYIYVNM